ncbi:hypothetical protein NEPTK9_000283 [Candidatus Neptunochlamydia vexilliferae]|uniref:Uncharacterized protein n=1 Tax=Candidatus Neptunichlamydia vexilliferae TaxID=1651774 RepID=A0ABS0AXC0_9BACT|nr:hypothetical protein [Candidatus Neptunochlamydia vexilliferae]
MTAVKTTIMPSNINEGDAKIRHGSIVGNTFWSYERCVGGKPPAAPLSFNLASQITPPRGAVQSTVHPSCGAIFHSHLEAADSSPHGFSPPSAQKPCQFAGKFFSRRPRSSFTK